MRITVEGIPELDAALSALPRVARVAALAKGIPVAAEIVKSAIVANAHFGKYSTGRLAGSIVFLPTQVGGEPSGVVKPDTRKGAGGRHAILVERGTAPHRALYMGRSPFNHPGTAAQAFFEPGVESSSDAALEAMTVAIFDDVTGYWNAQGGGEA